MVINNQLYTYKIGASPGSTEVKKTFRYKSCRQESDQHQMKNIKRSANPEATS